MLQQCQTKPMRINEKSTDKSLARAKTEMNYKNIFQSVAIIKTHRRRFIQLPTPKKNFFHLIPSTSRTAKSAIFFTFISKNLIKWEPTNSRF